MKNKATKSLLLLGLLVLLGSIVSAQTKQFKWEWGLCEFDGTYDSNKYTEAQIRDTEILVTGISGLWLFYDATAGKFENIEKLSLDDLEKEYKEKLQKLQNLKLVKGEIWEKLRRNKIKEMNQLYMLSKATIKGYKNPEALREFDKAECCANFYVQPLIAGGDYLITTWKKVMMDNQYNNADPEWVEYLFKRKNASPDRLKFARIEVMRMGWWNCANSMRYHLQDDEKNMPDDERYEARFNNLFTNLKSVCDEP